VQEYSLTACRPIEAAMTVLNNLKREALVLGRGLASEARERRRRRVAPWEYYASNPRLRDFLATYREHYVTETR